LEENYANIGCYTAKSNSCFDVFVETLSSEQCSNTIKIISGTTCALNCGTYSSIQSSLLTIEMCLQICSLNGFKLAGLFS
jgi:hypothetical protein